MSVPSGTEGVFIPLTVNNLLPSVDEETIRAFFNSAWFRAVDVDFAEEELSLLPITSVERQAENGGGSTTIWCRSKAVAEVVLTRLRGISYQGRSLEIFKLAGKPVPLDQLQPSALDRLVRSHDKKVALAKQNGDEVSHVSRTASLNRTANAPCFYDVLKIDRAAEGREIKEAYVKLRRNLDPLGADPLDLGRIVEAYDTLSDPLKRNVYDHRPLQFWRDAKKAKEQKDRRPAMWVLKHSNDIKNGRVRRVRCTDRQAQTLIQQARNVLTRVRGADLLVVAPLFPEVWISGNPQQLRNVEQMLKEAAEEADGHRAPADGVVLRVPPVHASKLPEGEKRTRFIEEIKAKTGSILSFCEDRIIIRGGQVPLAVAWIQGRVLWRAEITAYDGSKMDGWLYSLSAERALRANPELVPDREPDVDEVEAILRSESPQGTTAERALHALDAIFRGRSAMSFALLRLLTSKVVYHAVEQDQNILNQFIATLVRLWSKYSLQRPLYEFHKNSLLMILWNVPRVILLHANRYEQHLMSAIPTGQWVSWRQFLDTPGSPGRLWLHCFLTESAKASNLGVDEKWCGDHNICSFVLHYALGRYCHVDDQHGLCKRELVWFQGQAVQPVQPPVPQPVPPRAQSTTSKAKPPTPPEATKGTGSPPAPAEPAPAPPAPEPPPAAPEAPPAEPRRSESVSRSRSRPPAKIPVKAKIDMSGHWKDLTPDKAVTLRPSQAVELLLFAAEKKDHFRKGPVLVDLSRNIAKAGAGSVEGLCRLLEGKSLDLLQAISTLEKIAAVRWEEQTLLALVHAGLHDIRQKEDVSSTLSLLDNVVEVPWKDVLPREDCSVIPFLAESGDRRVQRKLCAVLGQLEGTSALAMEAVMASLEAAASSAAGFSVLSHVVKCFQSAGFDPDRMMTCVAGAFHRISKAGIEHMSDIWREVRKCVQMEVPEAMDCTLQHFRGFGSLHRFTDAAAPAEITIFLCGAAVRLDAQEVWTTDAFKQERLKKLDVRQLLSCLKALLGTGREEQRVFFKAALEKNNEVNFTAVEALLFVQVAHELKEVAELAQHQKIINRAIEQDSLVDCVKVLQTLVEHGITNLEKVSKGTAQRVAQIAQQMSVAQLENHLLELRAAVQLLHQQGATLREQSGQQPFAERMSALRNLREVASKQRCNDLCIGQIIAMFLSDPKSNRSSKKTLELAELLCGVVADQKGRYPPETECSLLVRVTGNNEAAQQILPGVYRVVGQHDQCSVYQRVVPHMDKTNAVFMYYWAEQHQWFVGPSVGSDSVWAYADDAKSSTRPPRRNWHWQKPLENKNKLVTNISVFCFEAGPAPGPTQAMPKTKAAVIQAKARPQEPGNSVQANVEPPTKKARPEVPPKNRAPKPAKPMPSLPAAQQDEKFENDKQRECMEWLKGLDNGKGEFTKYFEKLKEHYDADLDNIKLARFEEVPESGRYCIEKTFYEDIQASKQGHQMVFKKHILAIP